MARRRLGWVFSVVYWTIHCFKTCVELSCSLTTRSGVEIQWHTLHSNKKLAFNPANFAKAKVSFITLTNPTIFVYKCIFDTIKGNYFLVKCKYFHRFKLKCRSGLVPFWRSLPLNGRMVNVVDCMP